VFVIELLKVLDLSIKLLERSLSLIELVSLLTNLHMHSSQILIFLFASLSQSSDSTLTIFKITFELFNLQLETANI
jgi:hypothetical protein